MRQVGGAARMMFLGSGGGGERSRIGAIGFGLIGGAAEPGDFEQAESRGAFGQE